MRFSLRPSRVLSIVGLALAIVSGLAVAPRPRALAPQASSTALDALLEGLSPLSSARARVGGSPPRFTLPAAVNGPTTRAFRMADVLGRQPVVILFWATWCVPCQQELPFYQMLYERHRAAGLRIVGISMDNASTIMEAGPTAGRLGVTYDVVTDLDTRVTTQLNPRRSAPFSVWVNRAGRITWEREGFAPAEQQAIADGVARLLTDE